MTSTKVTRLFRSPRNERQAILPPRRHRAATIRSRLIVNSSHNGLSLRFLSAATKHRSEARSDWAGLPNDLTTNGYSSSNVHPRIWG